MNFSDNDIFPIVEENFVTPNAIKVLTEWIKKEEYLFEKHTSSIDYWNGKCIHYAAINYPEIKEILKHICLGMRKYIQMNITHDTRYLYSEFPQIVKWKKGDEMTPHADNIEQDGVTANASPWRSFGGVVYLNSDFEGGEIYYPNIGIKVTPKPGMIVLHPAGIKYTHGVSKITKGNRYTMVSFFSFEREYAGFDAEN